MSCVVLLAGEWASAWLALSITFLVASLGVVGLGWWVLRKDRLNRLGEDAEPDVVEGVKEAIAEHEARP
jgi:hypothetical protein